MADWKKILFEGSDIKVTSITASAIPEITTLIPDGLTVANTVLTVDSDNGGGLRTISTSSLNVPQGNTNFTLSSSANETTAFNASGDTLTITTSNPTYFSSLLTVNEAGNETTITFTPASGENPYLTGSAQLNIISGGISFEVATTEFNNGNLGGDWNTTIGPFVQQQETNTTNILTNKRKTDPSLDFTDFATGDNLWANADTDGGGTSEIPVLNPPGNGKNSYYWLSASLVGGFSDGTLSLSASYFNGSSPSITASIHSISQSLATI